MIEIKNLHKSFGHVEVLKGVDVSIEEKEVVVIIGPSGSGKSTLLRCMNYLEEPTSGDITVSLVQSAGFCLDGRPLTPCFSHLSGSSVSPNGRICAIYFCI